MGRGHLNIKVAGMCLLENERMEHSVYGFVENGSLGVGSVDWDPRKIGGFFCVNFQHRGSSIFNVNWFKFD